MRKLSAVLLLAVLACSNLQAKAPAASIHLRPRRTARTARTQRPRPESYPKMRAAITALEAAKAELEAAKINFGGHKSEALDAVNNALKRLRLALQFEKY